MIYRIILLILFCRPCIARESLAVSKFIEAAMIQTGLQKELEQSGKTIYTKFIDPEYRPYFDAGLSIGNAMATKKVYIQKTWEF